VEIKSIIRAKGGTAEREVQLSDVVIHDIRTFPLFLPDKRWIKVVARYHEDLGLLLGSVRANLELPSELFVPDLWDTSRKLPAQERAMMLDMWSLGHDLARGVGYTPADPADCLRNGVGGTVYLKPSAEKGKS
jgi:hypothetical protein